MIWWTKAVVSSIIMVKGGMPVPDMKQKVKDSVFTFLFSQPKYARELYLTLHPEDCDVREEDCKVITLKNVIVNGIYNDLGVQVKDRLILLVEAQSTFSVNIALRLLLYLAWTYKDYIEENMLDIYSTAPVKVPRPELYVVYTGDRKDVPETLRLSGLYEGFGDVEAQVHILGDKGTHSIIDQYIRFCEIADEQRRKYGRTQKAIEETLRICIEQNILVLFLESRKKEVHDIMTILFDHDTIMRIHDYNIAKQNREEGREEGREEDIREIVSIFKELSMEKSEIIQMLTGRFKLSEQAAKEKTEKYWK